MAYNTISIGSNVLFYFIRIYSYFQYRTMFILYIFSLENKIKKTLKYKKEKFGDGDKHHKTVV